MIENIVPVNLVHGSTLQMDQQQYPVQKPAEQDILKFKLELEPGGKIPPIFEVTNKATKIKEVDNSAFGLLKNIDGNYHQMLTSMSDLSKGKNNLKFKSLSESRVESEVVRTQPLGDVKGNQFVRTPEDTQNRSRELYKELLANQNENQAKGLQMMRLITNKTIGMQMFMSNLKIISAGVTQISSGFKTLFRSSG